MSDKNKIYLIGAGNLGLHLAKALKKTSYEFTGVFSRQPQNASMAAEILQCKAVDNLYNIPDNTEIPGLGCKEDRPHILLNKGRIKGNRHILKLHF